jgi:hypothetical protein
MPKYLLLFLLFNCFFVPDFHLQAQSESDSVLVEKNEVWDGGVVDYRKPPYEQIEQWKSMSRYQYDRDEGPGILSFIFSRVLLWLGSFMGESPWFFYVILILGGLLVFYLLLRLLDIPVSGLFVLSRHKTESPLSFGDEADEYPTAKLQEMLNMFRTNHAWREAVRVMFLLYLRELQNKGGITIKPFKTNLEYYREISDAQDKEAFRNRKRLFDVVWYGHVDLNAEQFGQVESVFYNRAGKEVRS